MKNNKSECERQSDGRQGETRTNLLSLRHLAYVLDLRFDVLSR